MPRKTDALPIGTAPCLACQTENKVYQNNKNYLYMRACPQCKSADQRISDLVQTTMFYSLKLGEGAVVERPRNVPETRPDWLDKPAPAPAPVPAPVQVHVPTPTPDPAPKKKGGGGVLWLILAGLSGTAIALISIVTNTTPRTAA